MTKNIKIENQIFIDGLGRTRIFRGMNYVEKGEPIPKEGRKPYKKGSKTDPTEKRRYELTGDIAYFEKLAGLGVNLIRLGVTWDSVEPEPGQYNEEYIDQIERFFDLANQCGIMVFLDMHQDLYSGFGAGYGDGAPYWATVTNGKHRIPFTGIWAEPYFFGNSTAKAFDNFWNNTEVQGKGLQDWYADMWVHLVERLKDKENLFGYDFLNEPYPGKNGQKVFRSFILRGARIGLFSKKFKTLKCLGNLRKNPKKAFDCITTEVFDELVSSGEKYTSEFDKTRYSPFINKMTSAVRKVTDKGIAMQGTCYWGNVGIHYHGQPIEVDGKRDNLQCFAPHAYDLMVDTPEYNYASTERMAFILKRHKESQERLNVPVVLGEWGCWCPNGTEWVKHLEEVSSILEEYQWSETYFCNKWYVDDENIKSIMQRSYPRAVAGTIAEYKTDKENNTFTLKYVCDNKDIKTEIYLPAEPKNITRDGGTFEFVKINGSESGILYVNQEVGAHEIVIEW